MEGAWGGVPSLDASLEPHMDPGSGVAAAGAGDLATDDPSVIARIRAKSQEMPGFLLPRQAPEDDIDARNSKTAVLNDLMSEGTGIGGGSEH